MNAPQFMIKPMVMKEAAKDPVWSAKTPPTIGPVKLDTAWNNLTKPYEDPIFSTPEIIGPCPAYTRGVNFQKGLSKNFCVHLIICLAYFN